MQELSQLVINSVEKLLSEKLKKLYYDKSFSSVVYGINENGTYKIPYMGYLYDVKNGMGIDLKLGQNVWVMIPNNELRNMFIYALNPK